MDAVEALDQIQLRLIDDKKSGRSEMMRSKSGSNSAPTCVRDSTAGGRVIVVGDADDRIARAEREDHLGNAGTSETMRCAPVCSVACGLTPEAAPVPPLSPPPISSSFPHQQPQEERSADQRGDDADGQLDRREHVRAITSQATRNAAPKNVDTGSTSRWSAPTSRRTRCGTMMPTKPIGPPIETAAPVASEALKNATRCARATIQPARLGAVGAEAQQIQRPRQPGEAANATSIERQRREDRP